MDNAELRERMARLEQKVESLKEVQAEAKEDHKKMQIDVDEILRAVNKAQGGFKTLMGVGAVAGAIGAIIVKMLPWGH